MSKAKTAKDFLRKSMEDPREVVEEIDLKKVPAIELSKTEKIVLKEHQGPHIEKIKGIFSKHNCAFDMSTMGAGKTYTTSQLSLDLKFNHVIVVCPVSVEAKWKSMAKYGVKLTNVMSYQSLRSIKNKSPKHGLLERYDSYDADTNTSYTFFEPTEYLTQIIKEGCLFVLDEAQHIKNKNDQFLACQAIAKAINKSGSGSRMLLLSGTPIDKEEHAVNIMQMLGIISSTRLYTFNKEEYKLRLYGARDLVDYCKYIDENKINSFIRNYPWRQDNVLHNCYLIFQQILKPAITSVMPSPPLDIDCKNGYYVIEPESDRKNLMKAIAELHSSVMYDERTKSVNVKKETIGAITKALSKIEAAKVNSMARVIEQTLEDYPTCKVGVFVNYTDSLFKLSDLLVKYKPLILYGSVNKNKRQELIDKFQEGNTKHRLIISNLKVASTGIDLDDKFGDFPRFAFASPNYEILVLHQLTRRFVRLDSKSNATFRFFYGLSSRKETSILNALARKTNVLKDTLEGQVEEGVVFPGDYEEELEG